MPEGARAESFRRIARQEGYQCHDQWGAPAGDRESCKAISPRDAHVLYRSPRQNVDSSPCQAAKAFRLERDVTARLPLHAPHVHGCDES
eukprot:CAMPEP_0181217682 /NCGR_PEP_ID=MMETSP1096-20121128/27283_1 /TAXON_ID=156174 ORGANISM="Chrysochromulina ericina, Strain CCMP281" /NCGR_SAMPLE_ID=MMETSP1096 /ASSEMBLY_ACC=CAM_ASM_000453 /LENGTH=88 /DNA_ID=CAMNT_0023309833 /DNA_START=90 /DNA_END=357 /DNA_ORIENTATION=+